MIWYFQLVHHDIWDYDMPPHPILLDLTVDGRPVKAVVQVTKQAFAYAFDRVSGKPIGRLKSVRSRRRTRRESGLPRRSLFQQSPLRSTFRESLRTI